MRLGMTLTVNHQQPRPKHATHPLEFMSVGHAAMVMRYLTAVATIMWRARSEVDVGITSNAAILAATPPGRRTSQTHSDLRKRLP